MQFDIAKELEVGLKFVKKMTGLTLTNLEKYDLTQRLKEYSSIEKSDSPLHWFSVGRDAAIGFLKDRYDYDILDPRINGMLDEIDIKGFEEEYPGHKSFDYFKMKQEEQHKP